MASFRLFIAYEGLFNKCFHVTSFDSKSRDNCCNLLTKQSRVKLPDNVTCAFYKTNFFKRSLVISKDTKEPMKILCKVFAKFIGDVTEQ